MQIWTDSSQAAPRWAGATAAICGRWLGGSARAPDRRPCVAGLITAGVLTVYPLLVLVLVLALACRSAIVLAFLGCASFDAVGRRFARSPGRQVARSPGRQLARWPSRHCGTAAPRLLMIVGLAALLTPIAFGRDLRYWQAILHGTFSFPGLPIYHLPGVSCPNGSCKHAISRFLQRAGEWDQPRSCNKLRRNPGL